MITIDEARDLLAKVREYAAKDDDEVAHSCEDELHVKVLRAVSHGSPDAKQLARIALTTTGVKFGRHCA